MMDTLLGGIIMVGAVIGWGFVYRRTADPLHPLGLMVLFWLLPFGFGHWDVPTTYPEPYYANLFDLRVYAAVVASIVIFALGYWLVDPGLSPLPAQRLSERLRACFQPGALLIVTILLFLVASLTTFHFYRTVGEIPLLSPRIEELRPIWKQPFLGYLYDLHIGVVLFGIMLIDRTRSGPFRLGLGMMVLASIAQLTFGAVRVGPLTAVVWGSVYVFYRGLQSIKIRHFVVGGLVVAVMAAGIEYARRTPIRLNPELSNPRLDMGPAATVWGHTAASFKNLQLVLETTPARLDAGTMSYDFLQSLNPEWRSGAAMLSAPFGVHNTGTYLFTLYIDFGIFGLLIMPGIYGVLTGAVYRRFRERTNILWLVIYIDFLLAVLLSFRTHRFLSNNLLFFGLVVSGVYLMAGHPSATEAHREPRRADPAPT